jgi:hypothetical protein
MLTATSFQTNTEIGVSARGELGFTLGEQQADMAVAALRREGILDEQGADRSDHLVLTPSIHWWIACPYCCARTYRVTYTPIQDAILVQGHCARCGTKGQGLLR